MIERITKTNHRVSGSTTMVLILIAILSAQSDTLALSPYDDWGYTAPVDSVVTWFHDYCNQNQQVRAFWMITENGDGYVPPYQMVRIKPEYDLPAVRDAFVFYMRSITVDKQTSTCQTFYPSYWLGSFDMNEPDDWEGFPINESSLSLYMNLGYTQDLYQMADSCFSYGKISYFAYLCNELGEGYFQHLESEFQSDPNYSLGINIAGYYLQHNRIPDPNLRDLSLNILHLAAISTSEIQRYRAAEHLALVYVKGYEQVKPDILLLTNDPKTLVSNRMRGSIRTQQNYSKKMLNFLNDE